MIWHTQWQGVQADAAVGRPAEHWLPWVTQEFFDISEYVFFSIYFLDVCLKLYVLRREWWFDPQRGRMFFNAFDAILVLVNAIELLVVPLVTQGRHSDVSGSHVRIIKLLKVVRTFRVFKAVSMFRHLKNLVATCLASVGALFWSIILLLLCMLAFALVICQALQSAILDESLDVEVRFQMNAWYGNFMKSMYTMFEITLSGGWPLLVRPVIDYVSPWYAVLFLPYVMLIVFAVLRIVTALFIKETLQSAENDAEMMIQDSRTAQKRYQRRLEELFRLADDDGDGHLTLDEFRAACSLPSVEEYLSYMDVTLRDCEPLFEILAEGDRLITITEFCKGVMQLKGLAKAIDIVMLKHENAKLMSEIQDMHRIILSAAKQHPSRKASRTEELC